MTNSLFNRTESLEAVNPVSLFDYRDMQKPSPCSPCESKAEESQESKTEQKAESPKLTAQEVEALVAEARDIARREGREEAEKRLRAEYESKLASERARVKEAIERFTVERKSYFLRVESDVVKLSLAIAAKILHREAQVDPLLLAALVRVAVERLQDGSKVIVRVAPGKGSRWNAIFAHLGNDAVATVTEDSNLSETDCILETDIGSANFSIDSQLKEIEQGFFDLLAQRPN